MTEAAQPYKESLKEEFFRHAAGKWLFQKSEKISSYGFVAGNVILMLKDGIDLTPSSFAGFLFLGSAISLRLTKKFPAIAFRVAGLCSIVGAASLALGAHNGNASALKNTLECGATFIGFGVPGAMIAFEKELANLSLKWQDSQNFLKRKFSDLCRYPVSSSTLLDSIGIGSLYKRAVMQGDVGIGLATGLWIFAEFGLIASDPRLQKQFTDYHEKSPAAPDSPAPAIS